MGMNEKEGGGEVSRRDFLANAAMGAGLVAALGTAGYYGIRYLVPRPANKRFVDVLVANLEELTSGAAREFIDAKGRKGILINNDGTVKAFSKICTHLGCEVEWHSQKKEFFCPCHEGFFDANGKNIKGPPPRPLNEFKVTVKDDNIYVALEEV
jgi:Rieske Fe-S protein